MEIGEFGTVTKNSFLEAVPFYFGGYMELRLTHALTPTQPNALTSILDLRRLMRETGTITTKAQNDILRCLNSADLAAVANALAE